MLNRLFFVLLPWSTMGAVDLSTTLSVECIAEDGAPVAIRWITETRPDGAGEPGFVAPPPPISQGNASWTVVLPDARPGIYAFRAEIDASGWTVRSDPVQIQVVGRSGTVQQETVNGSNSGGGGGGGGGGCGAGTALGLVLGLLPLSLKARKKGKECRKPSDQRSSVTSRGAWPG